MMKLGTTLLIAFSFSLPLSGHAFSLKDHKRITHQSFLEFNDCFQNVLRQSEQKILQKAIRGEDTNLFRKWLKYSHYFHPKKKLKMRRKDSSVRVLEIQFELESHILNAHLSREKALKLLGGAIHHLQDAASPPHAVPVSHGLKDGFERYPLPNSAFPDVQILHDHCQRIEQNVGVSLFSILKANSSETLKAVHSPLFYLRNGEKREALWTLFWSESGSNKFGSYGFFGNRFGQTVIKKSGKRYEIESSQYKEFKRKQVRAAIDASKSTLYWFYSQIMEL